jgi:cysteine--tRNA ligase
MLDKISKILSICSENEIKEIEEINDIFMVRVIKNNLKDSNLLSLLDKFSDAVASDLNTPNALVYLYSVIKEKTFSQFDILITVAIMDLILGLNIIKEAKKLMNSDNQDNINIKTEEINDLINERNLAKQKKDYKKADEIREQLKMNGIILEDTKDGTIWKYLK